MPCAVNPSNCGRRALVSQDHQEIYLTFAEYDEQYVEYIRDEHLTTKKSHSFLTMNEFGPLYINNHQHMMRLGIYILALTHQQFLTEENFTDLESTSKDVGKPSATGGKKRGKA